MWLVKDVNVTHNFKNIFYCEELFTLVEHSIDVKIKKSQLEFFFLSIKANLERNLKKMNKLLYMMYVSATSTCLLEVPIYPMA